MSPHAAGRDKIRPHTASRGQQERSQGLAMHDKISKVTTARKPGSSPAHACTVRAEHPHARSVCRWPLRRALRLSPMQRPCLRGQGNHRRRQEKGCDGEQRLPERRWCGCASLCRHTPSRPAFMRHPTAGGSTSRRMHLYPQGKRASSPEQFSHSSAGLRVRAPAAASSFLPRL